MKRQHCTLQLKFQMKIKKSDIWYAGLHGFSEKEAEKDFIESFLK